MPAGQGMNVANGEDSREEVGLIERGIIFGKIEAVYWDENLIVSPSEGHLR